MDQQLELRPTTSAKWAPWWLYVVIIVDANYLRWAALDEGSTPPMRFVVALTFSAVLFAVITVVHRATRPPMSSGRSGRHRVRTHHPAGAGRGDAHDCFDTARRPGGDEPHPPPR